MSDCVAQGRLSIESVGRLVELERLACLRSPKPNFERTPSWQDVDDADDDSPALPRSISDSLADAAFTMELGECDVDDDHSEDMSEVARPRRASYTESPYRYSFCAFSGDDADTANIKGARVGVAVHTRSGPCRPISSDFSVEARANRSSLAHQSAQEPRAALESKENALAWKGGGHEVAHAQQALAKMICDTSKDSKHPVPPQSKRSDADAFCTPTNIEDGIDFGEGEHEPQAVFDQGLPDSKSVVTTSSPPANARMDLSAYYKQRRRGSSMRRSNSDPQLVCRAKR